MRRVRCALAVAVAVLGAAWGAPAAQAFAISAFKTEALAEGGAPDVQAGSHPSELTTTVDFALAPGAPAPGGPYTEGDLRDLQLEEPAGLIEDPAALPQCAVAQFHTPRVSPFEASQSGESCPDKSQVGVVTLETSLGGPQTRSFGVFNLAPPPGAPSQLGFDAYGVPVTLTPTIRQASGEYGVSLELRNLSQSFDLRGLALSLWGTPWSLTHDTERGDCLNESDLEDPWAKCSVGRPIRNPALSYLTLPPSCSGPLTTHLAADSWQQPGAYLPSGEPDLGSPGWSTATSTAAQGLSGCDRLPFAPEGQGKLTTDRAASASGFDLIFNVGEEGLTNPKLLAPSQPRTAVVRLAEGMTLNPSLAAGLGVCTPAQYAAETVSAPPGAGCPEGSKIGDFTVQSPLYGEAIQGALFLAAPHENPFGTLLALYIVAKAPGRGIIVKVAGKVEPDPTTGRLTATFEGLPQLPYTHFDVHFREGQRSPLLSPPSCGAYATAIEFTPWLEAGATAVETSPFPISSGPEGSACPAAVPPFAPGAAAGALNSQAGAYSPFYLHLTRTDTEAEITSYSATLPPGLLGNLSGIPYCPDSAIEAAKHESGVAEEEHPSCPAASQIGHTTAGYGVGSVLAYAPGGLYLAGPFHGAPFSIVAIDSATVGPFDLGTVVIRSAIDIDPLSARVTVDSAGSDPIPHILSGVPLHLRDIRVYIDRPGFTVDPTSCDPFQVVSSLTGSYAPFADPRGESASVPVGFQMSNCSALGFAPKLALHLEGATRRGAYPSLRAIVTPRPGDANIAAAAVTLPSTEFLAQNHIGTVCTRPQFAREACPAASVYGHATAVTPLLEKPLEGPVYLRSSENLLPDLVTQLHGQGVTIDLDGRIDSHHGGLRGTFEGLPDAPVTKFTMVLFGGRKKGLLVNERNICTQGTPGSARFLAQDDSTEVSAPSLEAHCPKPKKKRKKGKHKKDKGGHHRSHRRGGRSR